MSWFDFREVVLGEHDVRQDPDPKGCEGDKCFPKKIVKKVSRIIKHKDYAGREPNTVNDIALIRLDEPVLLYQEDQRKSAVMPVCIPWNENDPGNYILEDGANTLITGWGRRTNDSNAAAAEFQEFTHSS